MLPVYIVTLKYTQMSAVGSVQPICWSIRQQFKLWDGVVMLCYMCLVRDLGNPLVLLRVSCVVNKCAEGGALGVFVPVLGITRRIYWYECRPENQYQYTYREYV